MSRIGKAPIVVPNGVEVKVDGTKLVFKGKVERELETHGRVNVEVKDNNIVFTLKSDTREHRAFWGTYRALASNIVEGLSKGYEKGLEINGVGYRAAVNGKVLELALGFSHPVNYDIPEDITIEVDKKATGLLVKGVDKQLVGQVAAKIRSFRPPEPYKGKGVKYTDEVIVRKAGKTAK
ncbi:MAG: 50S ribosomal protein L6 [Campylobacterales bacterium]|nr:50S ribosomal protein L6 [Campylobacterales bacterium]